MTQPNKAKRSGINLRKDLARELLVAGSTTREIMQATKAKTGTAIGGSTLNALRISMKGPSLVKKASTKKPPPQSTALQSFTTRLIRGLVRERVAFTFDGRYITLNHDAP